MAATRLPFLYPQLLLRTARAATSHTVAAAPWSPVERRFARATSSPRCKSTFAPRVGKAVAPTAWEEQQKTEPIELPPPGEAPVATPGPSVATPVEAVEATLAELTTDATAETVTATAIVEPPKEEDESPEALKRRQNREEAKSGGPLESVMHMEPPEGVEGGGFAVRPPTMTAPPYVHHFDSYSMVKQLEDGGYTRQQATTSMKAIRKLLADNLEVAEQSLVSKNDIENETYLFAAACSELNTEVKNNQRLQDERMRQERTHVQHEVDILSQSLASELVTLNDNVRGMFNDRKMAARDEQKAIESAVQKLHYKISIVLTSDAKSEIEGVRWVLIQRSVLGIIFMALITLGALRYATFVKQQKKEEADKKRKAEKERRNGIGRQDHTAGPDAAAILAAN